MPPASDASPRTRRSSTATGWKPDVGRSRRCFGRTRRRSASGCGRLPRRVRRSRGAHARTDVRRGRLDARRALHRARHRETTRFSQSVVRRLRRRYGRTVAGVRHRAARLRRRASDRADGDRRRGIARFRRVRSGAAGRRLADGFRQRPGSLASASPRRASVVAGSAASTPKRRIRLCASTCTIDGAYARASSSVISA